ncbi:MAG: CBS domain-containing protein [Blastococcus sp.]|nr:CBS domain-containing protein [Blastococcus sp.]
MQTRDVMTRDVITVGPDSSVKHAAEVMSARGFAALPVVDGNDRLVGIVAEADVLRDRLPPDPRLHLRRDEPSTDSAPPQIVSGVMTALVRSVQASADIADVARLFVDERVRSVPVQEHGRTVGIVSRRDLLIALARPDDSIQADLLRVVEDYTGEAGLLDVEVTEGAATVRRTDGTPQMSAGVEERALQELARTVAGVVSIRVLPPIDASARSVTESRGTP